MKCLIMSHTCLATFPYLWSGLYPVFLYQCDWLDQESVFLRDWEDEQVTVREPHDGGEGPEDSHRVVCRRYFPLDYPSTGGVLVVSCVDKNKDFLRRSKNDLII